MQLAKEGSPRRRFFARVVRDGQLSRKDLTARLAALRALAAGNRRPAVAGL